MFIYLLLYGKTLKAEVILVLWHQMISQDIAYYIDWLITYQYLRIDN